MADTKKPNTEETLRKAGPTVKQPDSDSNAVKRNPNVDVPTINESDLPRSHTPGS